MIKNYIEYREMLNEKLSQGDLSALQKKYREYFKFMLDCYEVKSPKDFSDDEKKVFFDNIKKYWVKGHGPSKDLEKIKEDICGKEDKEEKKK